MENEQILNETIVRMMANGKGIVALDESTSTAGKRLADIGIDNTEDNRRTYRELFVNAEGMQQYASGVILYDETLRQADRDGKLFRDTLNANGVVIGIKVDEGIEPVLESPQESLTKGLEHLEARLPEYFELGARFAKWRVAIPVSDSLPTEGIVKENASRLAKYAQLCQRAGIVPMVEPEVLMDGDHSQARAKEVTALVLSEVIAALNDYQVWLPGVIVKTSMVVPGKDSDELLDPKKVALDTVEVLNAHVPSDIGGVVFLSGGQTTDEALRDLDAIAEMEPLSFPIACSFGRALQKPALDVWQGDDANIPAAQKAFVDVLRQMSLADLGKL